MRIVVVGAGLGGLSAAAHLINRGHQVTVLERESVPGGRAGVVAQSGFQLDTGPTMLTMPEVLQATFAAAGSELADSVRLRPVDPMYRAVFGDGSTLYIRRGREAMTDEIRTFSGARDAEAFGRFSDWLESLHRIEMSHFVDVNFDSPFDLVRSWRAVASVVGRGGFGRMGKRMASYFDDERLQRVFGSQSLYAGLAPHQALAVQTVVTHTDTHGVFVPDGGMHTIAKSLAGAVEKAGVTIRYRSPVTRLLRGAAGSINGVEVGGSTRIAADAVVCNADLPVAYRTLLGGVDAPRVAGAAATHRPACSGSPACGVSDQRAPRTTTCTSATRGTPRSGPSSSRGAGCGIRRSSSRSRPPIRRSRPMGARRCTCSSRCRTSTGASTGRRSAIGSPATCAGASRRSVTRATSSSSASTTRSTGRRWGSNVARRSPSPTRCARAARSARTTSTSGCRGWSSSARRRVPGLGVPMVLISGRLAADRVDQYARETSIVRW